MQTRILAGAGLSLAAANLYVRSRARRAERTHPPRGRFIDSDGVRLHYYERGDGPPLVLLHGLGSSLEDFATSGLVAEASRRYRVLAFDRPGYGYSTRPRGRIWHPWAQAAVLRSALRQLEAHRPIMLGHSWGALVAVAYAQAFPGGARSLVLASGL